jgi:four helix bundle protein
MASNDGTRGMAAGEATPDVFFEAQRMDVYQAALDFHALAETLSFGKRARELQAQLDRASTSIVLNIAEATGRRGLADRARFLAMARGSATECAAILDIVRARGLAGHSVTNEGRTLLLRIVQMLTRWCQRLDSDGASPEF